MEPLFTIEKIVFNSEKFDDKSVREIEPGNLMVIVGPNNSGKTRVMEDLNQYLTQERPQMQLISEVKLHHPQTKEDFINALKKFEYPISQIAKLPDDVIVLFRPNYPNPNESLRINYKINRIENYLSNKSLIENIKPDLTKFATFTLDAIKRFDLLTNQNIQSFEDPQNFLGLLFNDDKFRQSLRTKIYNEFGLYFYLDTSHPPNSFTIKLSRNKLSDIEKSLKNEEMKKLRELLPITSYGHGIQAFTGILLSVSTTPFDIILIDEPEAFLHPPQAVHIGRYLADITNQRKGTTIVVTHSPEILMGCVENAEKVKIIRLTYDNVKGSVKEIQPSLIQNIISTPKLRSTALLDAFFYKSAIIVEGDSDRVFYSEINRILGKKGINDSKFLGSYGEQTIKDLVTPLRKVGIPAAAIFDYDSIKHVENFPFNAHLKKMGIPQEKIQYIEEERRFIEGIYEKSGKSDKEFFKKEGLNILTGDDLERGEKLLEFLTKYGVFIVPQGTLESWIKEFKIPKGDKQKWVECFFDLAKEKAFQNKIKTKADDVVKFIFDIKKWLENPRRLGMND